MFTPTLNLVLSVNTDNETQNLVNTLANYGVHGKTASNDEWLETYRATYYLNGSYYGLTKKTDNITKLENELKYNNIDYYLIWNGNDVLKFSEYTEITDGKIRGLLIYSKN